MFSIEVFAVPSVIDFSIFVACSVAWLIGWALILEYTIGGSAVARGISPNLVWWIFYFLSLKTLFI